LCEEGRVVGDIVVGTVISQDDTEVIVFLVVIRQIEVNLLCTGLHAENQQEQHKRYFVPVYMLHIPKLSLLHEVLLKPVVSSTRRKSFPSGNFWTESFRYW
jgi:hypothetical protein